MVACWSPAGQLAGGEGRWGNLPSLRLRPPLGGGNPSHRLRVRVLVLGE